MKVKEIKEFLEKVDNPALLFNKLLVLKYTDKISKGQEIKKNEYIKDFKNTLQKGETSKPPKVDGYPVKTFKLKTAYRLVIGAGYPSFIENGFMFHHVYGIPYIPGETLKGLARSVFLMSIREALKPLTGNDVKLSDIEEKLSEEAANQTLKNLPQEINIILDEYTIKNPVETFLKIFGSKKRRGQVIFFDAYPVNFNPSENFETDIMNPHYADYYQANKPPADWLNPNPIYFLAIKEGVEFEFNLGLAQLEPMEKSEETLLLETAYKLLIIGLENFGVGNKKRKGYGGFK